MCSRAGAGLVAGFFLAAALVGLVGWALPGPWQSTIVPGLVAFFPLWIGAAGMAFGLGSGRRAWAWLGGLALACFTLLWALRALDWVQCDEAEIRDAAYVHRGAHLDRPGRRFRLFLSLLCRDRKSDGYGKSVSVSL